MKFLCNNISRATQYLLFLIVALIPFSIRYVFDTPFNYHTGAYSDFTSISLYISDLVLISLIGITLFHKKHLSTFSNLPNAWRWTSIFTVAWIILELFLQAKDLLPIQLYFSTRIILLIIFACTISWINFPREKLAWLFTILGLIQSLIATAQFYSQKSIGLYLLGESHISPETSGVAKIVSHGTKLIRGYGTFPHSNLLSAFLVTSTVFNLYLLIKSIQKPRGESISRGTYVQIFLSLALILNIFAIFLTFSRAGIIALLASIVVMFLYLLINKRFLLILKTFLPVILGVVVSISILYPHLTTRATISDTATKERVFYNQVAKKIISDKLFFGLGPGTSVIHMKQYSPEPLKPWEIQPIHNYYLISWAEWGIGAIPLLILLIMPIILLFKGKRNEWSTSLISICLAFLLLFLFDHYFYTIWPTQLLLWLIVGLNLNYLVSHETTYDTASDL